MRLEPATVPHSNPLVALRGDVAFGTFGLLSPPARSQEWPARPLTMVVPTAAGGGADARIARQFGLSQSDVRKALTTGASKGGSIG